MSIDLTTGYGCLQLKSPIIVGSCPLTAQDMTRTALEIAGAGALILPSLFEERLIAWNQSRGQHLTLRERRLLAQSRRMHSDRIALDVPSYLALVQRATGNTSIPIIGSLNGEYQCDWSEVAVQLQQAGTAAIELSFHHASGTTCKEPRSLEEEIVQTARSIHEAVDIPLFIKLGKHFTSHSYLAQRLIPYAQGLALFGRSPETDISLDHFQVKTSWRLTHPGSISQSLAELMRVHRETPQMSLAASGGISSSADVVKALLSGADAALVTSAIYREGPDTVRKLIDGLLVFMERHHFVSLSDLFRKRPIDFHSEQERLEYIQAISTRPAASNDPEFVMNATQGDRWGHPDS